MASDKEKSKSRSEKDKKSSKSVTLKRTVTIKALVTDKFREYMRFEIQNANQNAQQRIGQLKAELVKPGLPAIIKDRLEAERVQLEQNLSELSGRSKLIDGLKDGELFVQGMIDGFVNISVGDNLYEKLGGMEIVVRDGIIEKINAVAKLA